MREKKLEEKRKEMAVVIAKLNEQNEQMETLKQTQSKVLGSLENIYESGQELDILEITNYKGYFGRLIVEIKNQEEVIKKTEDLLRVKKLFVTEALKEVKVLEKLKEKQEKDFYKQYEYIQAKEIDDIASTRYRRAS